MWEAIGYVGSGLALIAFISAVSATVYKHKSNREENLIKTAPDKDRAELIRNALEFFHVETGNLTRQQQYDIALEQIRNRSKNLTTSAIVIVVIALILSVLSSYAIYKSGDNSNSPIQNSTLSGIVSQSPSSYTQADTRGSAVQVFDNGWMVANFSRGLLFSFTKDQPLKWFKIKSEYVKGNDISCDNPKGDKLLRLGFCWFYNLPDNNEMRGLLGKPLAKETRAWLQYQEYSDDILIYGIPTTKPGTESGIFQTLAAVYLEGEKTELNGTGRYMQINESTVSGNPYCSANWYAATKNKNLPGPLVQLIGNGSCQKAVGTEEFVKSKAEIRLL